MLVNTFKYTAFGEILTSSGTKSTDYLYTGQRNEAETGLYFYKARYYDPALGRFIQPDALVPDPASSTAYDRYAYINNNPIIFNDPSGTLYINNLPCTSCTSNLPKMLPTDSTLRIIVPRKFDQLFSAK